MKNLSRKKLIYIVVGIFAIFSIGAVGVRTAKYYPFLFELLFKKDISLKKADHNINVLLLGIGGGTHEGPDLTDTIIFASLNQAQNKITLVSIPRDFWVLDLNSKINTAYYYGETKSKGGGITLAKAVVSKILGQPVDYVARIDFNGFIRAVDEIGGLDIQIDNTFDDYEYPVKGKEEDLCGHAPEEIDFLATSSAQLEAFPCRYKHVHFEKGENHMNGEQALEYVRSRHAQGEEGTDFARSKRQEKVIEAFKNKVFSLGTFINPGKFLSLYSILEQSIDTNIKQGEFDDFIRLAQKMKNAKIQSAVLDYGDSEKGRPGLLVNPPAENYKDQWVLEPRVGSGDFSEIQQYVGCEIRAGNCKIEAK